jgi:hypothetical protein
MYFILSVSQPGLPSGGGLIFLVLLVSAIAFASKLLPELLHGRRSGSADGPLPYKTHRYLFSRAERSFYEVLRRVVEPDCRLFAKVRLADLVSVPKGTPDWQAHFNRVQSKHVDFVICDVRALRVVAVVELDDSSHSAASRQGRDSFVDRVLASVGIPIVRVKASEGYAPAKIRELLEGPLRAAVETEAVA